MENMLEKLKRMKGYKFIETMVVHFMKHTQDVPLLFFYSERHTSILIQLR